MRMRLFEAAPLRVSLAFVLLVILLTALCVAGGASVPDVSGQVIVRSVSAAVIVIAVLFCDWPASGSGRAPGLFLLAAAGLAAAQLIPMPPVLWQSLPARAFMQHLVTIPGQADVWRPWSIAPPLTLNALLSLIVPAVTLLLLRLVPERERLRLPGLVLTFILAATLVGLLQFSGSHIRSPFINYGYEVSGPFANRNHFALLLACGCLVAPAWASLNRRGSLWRAVTAIGLVILFLLAALASGSRAGFALALLTLPITTFLLRDRMRRWHGHAPKWAFAVAITAAGSLIVIFVTLAILADRGASISRIYALNTEADLRFRTLPTVLELVRAQFPIGSGMGTFDPLFRVHEPFELLERTYFNHAHNDFIEIVINGGIIGAMLLAAGVVWWVTASVRTWRARSSPESLVARLGSAVLLVILLAALVDYAARTPIMMAMIMIAAVWLDSRVINPPQKGQAVSIVDNMPNRQSAST